jgi:agmatinase
MSNATLQFKTGEFAYANNTSRFMACAPLAAGLPLAICGVPWDGSVTNRPGARFGPQEIRRASLMLVDGIHPEFDVSPLAHLGDAGDMKLPNTLGSAAAHSAIEAAAKPLMAAHHCVFLGGDHSVTLPLIRAAHAQHGKLALIHFDAHCDTWDNHFGEPSGHGTWTRDVMEAGLVDPRRTVQIGIRSSGERSAREYVRDKGGAIYTGKDLRGLDGAALAPIIAQIRERMGDSPCYISFDIDALDPAFAPGTGTPEPGGLTSAQAMSLMEALSPLNTVGMDLCEVLPAYDHAEITSLAAATLVWTYLSAKVAQKNLRA